MNPIIGMLDHVISEDAIDWRKMASLGLQAAGSQPAPTGPLRLHPSLSDRAVNVRPFQPSTSTVTSTSGFSTVGGSMVGDPSIIDTGRMAADIADELAGYGPDDPQPEVEVLPPSDGVRRYDPATHENPDAGASASNSGGTSSAWMWGLGGFALGFGLARSIK